MCLLGCDVLFERGYVWGKHGKVCSVSPRDVGIELRPVLKELSVGLPLWIGRETYLRWQAERARSGRV